MRINLNIKLTKSRSNKIFLELMTVTGEILIHLIIILNNNVHLTVLKPKLFNPVTDAC